MGKFIDITGQKYNMLFVLEFAEMRGKRSYWKCLCDCGNITYVSGANLKSGAVKSCGCLQHTKKTTLTHGMSKTRLYKEWASIKNRCYNPKVQRYKYYGGRGIIMCNEWKDDFIVFASWALENGYTDELTIERIDINKNYCPENCKWIPHAEQAKNKSSCKYFTYNGKTQNLTDWCNELGLYYKTIHSRIFRCGWSFEKAISEPLHFQKRKMEGDCNG